MEAAPTTEASSTPARTPASPSQPPAADSHPSQPLIPYSTTQSGPDSGQPPSAAVAHRHPPQTPAALPVPTFEEAGTAKQTIDKLKAQKAPLSPDQQQTLDAAEKTFARRTEYNILNQQAGIEKRGGKLHPTTAKALADAQAILARLGPGGNTDTVRTPDKATSSTASSSAPLPPADTAPWSRIPHRIISYPFMLFRLHFSGAAQGLCPAGLIHARATRRCEEHGRCHRRPAAKEFWKNLLRNVPKHALADIPQELPDELFSQMMSALAVNHNADLGQVLGDFIQRSPGLMGAILLMGGAGGAIKTHQDTRSSPGQAQVDAATGTKTGENAQQNTTSEQKRPANTTQETAGTPGRPPPPPAARPSGPPKDLATSQKIITNLEERRKHRPPGPVEQADLDQARGGVAEAAAAKARPSGPPPTLQIAQARIHHIMDRPVQQRGHPTTQADLGLSCSRHPASCFLMASSGIRPR